MATDDQYQQDRNAAYSRILALLDGHIAAVAPPLTTDISLISISDSKDAAAHDVWKLFRNGVAHLKDGGPGGQPGMFAEAVSKASLRNASIASTLGLRPPKFDENYLDVEFDSGAAEAVFRCRRMLEAAAADAPKSQQLLRQKLGFATPLAAPDKAPDIRDPELKGVFDAAMKSGAAGSDAGQDPFLAAVRKQTVLSFNLICDLYAPMSATLKQEILELFTQPPPRPGIKNQSFDF